MPLHAKLRDTTLMEVVLHGYAISDVHGSGNMDPIPDVAMVQDARSWKLFVTEKETEIERKRKVFKTKRRRPIKKI